MLLLFSVSAPVFLVRGDGPDEILGTYELSAGLFNYWHYVTISAKGCGYSWNILAGAGWSMRYSGQKDGVNMFAVGTDSTYYDSIYTTSKLLVKGEVKEIEGEIEGIVERTLQKKYKSAIQICDDK